METKPQVTKDHIKKELERIKHDNDRLTYIETNAKGIKGIAFESSLSSIPSDLSSHLNDYIEEKAILIKRIENRVTIIKNVENDLQRNILLYKYKDFLTQKEIASITGYSFSYIQKQMTEGLETIAKLINKGKFSFFNEIYTKRV